jgi:hypothetical protein
MLGRRAADDPLRRGQRIGADMTNRQTLTPPKTLIPIGWVTINGQRLAVTTDPEWQRYFDAMFKRQGGTYAPTNNDLDAFMQFDIREADSAELKKAVRDLEVAVAPDQTAALAEALKRISDIEQQLSIADALVAQVAQLRSQIADLQITGAFA